MASRRCLPTDRSSVINMACAVGSLFVCLFSVERSSVAEEARAMAFAYSVNSLKACSTSVRTLRRELGMPDGSLEAGVHRRPIVADGIGSCGFDDCSRSRGDILGGRERFA